MEKLWFRYFDNNIFIRYLGIGDIIIRNYDDLFVWILKHAYICFRMVYENKFCWMDQGISVYFLAVPSLLTIFINIFFLGSVVKVIRCHIFSIFSTDRSSRSKLHFENNFNRNHKDMLMKSARAVLILVPIFGLHFLLLPMRPAKDSSLVYPYEVDFKDFIFITPSMTTSKLKFVIMKFLNT